jgi:hypothetical protein
VSTLPSWQPLAIELRTWKSIWHAVCSANAVLCCEPAPVVCQTVSVVISTAGVVAGVEVDTVSEGVVGSVVHASVVGGFVDVSG